MNMRFWHLEFYRINSDGTRVGPEGATVNPPSVPLQSAIDKARSIVRNNTFAWGKANCFVIKNQDGKIEYQETSYSRHVP
jgi:hypothetical protein